LIATAGDQLFDQGTLVISEHDIACGHGDPQIEMNGRLCQARSVTVGVQPHQGLRIVGLSRHPCDASTSECVTTVHNAGRRPPFALSSSKGASGKVIQQGFDRLSPNGIRLPAQLSSAQRRAVSWVGAEPAHHEEVCG
jgi:hypothetical protein